GGSGKSHGRQPNLAPAAAPVLGASAWGQSQPILTYAYKDHQILLLVPAERLMVMLRQLCHEALQSPSRSHQELARPILVSLKTSPYQSFEQVIEYTLML
ncbi:MAG: hypothetical protein MUF49_02440, partial [Oculatellaceae cyanobacterium Prado106]|nr:hypothetical protein [Oculatellaceae cyanobacterium Prado106]